MPRHIDDEVLNTFAVVGTYDEIADKIVERHGGVLAQVGFNTAVDSEDDAQRLATMVGRIQSAGGTRPTSADG